MIRKTLVRATLALALSPMAAFAAPITQNLTDSSVQINFFSPVGQTFTAEDARVSVGFFIQDFNPHIAPADDDVSITLYAGVGNGGAVLGSTDITGLGLGFANWVDADFSSIALAIGQVYTAIISDDTERWGVQVYQFGSDAYANGDLMLYGSPSAGHDARFRVLPQAVPEPASFALAALGLLGLAARRRRTNAAS